jgi:lysyl-tRNA synthetase class 2
MTDRIPYRFDVTRTAASLHEEFDGLETGAETGAAVTAAGRVMLRRVQGKITFAQLQTGPALRR